VKRASLVQMFRLRLGQKAREDGGRRKSMSMVGGIRSDRISR
jgi:hypothetical protein